MSTEKENKNTETKLTVSRKMKPKAILIQEDTVVQSPRQP